MLQCGGFGDESWKFPIGSHLSSQNRIDFPSWTCHRSPSERRALPLKQAIPCPRGFSSARGVEESGMWKIQSFKDLGPIRVWIGEQPPPLFREHSLIKSREISKPQTSKELGMAHTFPLGPQDSFVNRVSFPPKIPDCFVNPVAQRFWERETGHGIRWDSLDNSLD